MNVQYFDHTRGRLVSFVKTLEIIIKSSDVVDGDLLYLNCGTPQLVENSVENDDLLIVHTDQPMVWVDWVGEREELSLLLISREPKEQLLRIVEEANLGNCSCYHESVRDNDFNKKHFNDFLCTILDSYKNES